jgi:hypothetical protein
MRMVEDTYDGSNIIKSLRYHHELLLNGKRIIFYLLMTSSCWLPTTQASSSTTYFRISSIPTCTNGISFDSTNFQANCSGYNCKFGDEMSIAGSISLTSDAATMMPQLSCVNTKACFMGSSICRSYTSNNIDLCQALGVTNNGVSCPAATTYVHKQYFFCFFPYHRWT